MIYPRVLIVAIGRINKADTSNNGLLLRNLFGNFPRKNIAQIYSSGNNGDAGFFGSYYQLEHKDRRLGQFFFKLKNISQLETKITSKNAKLSRVPISKRWILFLGKQLLMDTGLYEIIFKPQLSQGMIGWVEKFKPDIIFSQGYNLAFTWLPLMLSKHFQLPIVYYPTDDWSNNRYTPELGYHGVLSRITRYFVVRMARKLVESALVCIAFNEYMKEEYLERFGVNFIVLMQGDTRERYEAILPQRLVQEDEYWIVCAGDFDQHRLPLLSDLDKACKILNARGIKVQVTAFLVNEASELTAKLNDLTYIQFEQCPTHNGLVSYLKGANILFLPERFDNTVPLIRLSISSKAHLFMFSGRPIVVYSDSNTGIAKYANEEGWAIVVNKRDPQLLADTFEKLITNHKEKQNLIDSAHGVAMKNHNLSKIQSRFCNLILNPNHSKHVIV